MDIRKLVADQFGALMMTNLELLAQNKALEDRVRELEAAQKEIKPPPRDSAQ